MVDGNGAAGASAVASIQVIDGSPTPQVPSPNSPPSTHSPWSLSLCPFIA